VCKHDFRIWYNGSACLSKVVLYVNLCWKMMKENDQWIVMRRDKIWIFMFISSFKITGKCLFLLFSSIFEFYRIYTCFNVVFFLRITTLLSWLKSTLLLKIKCFDKTIFMKTQCLQTNETQHCSRKERCLRSGMGKRKGRVN
jgi:hypothetical protein